MGATGLPAQTDLRQVRSVPRLRCIAGEHPDAPPARAKREERIFGAGAAQEIAGGPAIVGHGGLREAQPSAAHASTTEKSILSAPVWLGLGEERVEYLRLFLVDARHVFDRLGIGLALLPGEWNAEGDKGMVLRNAPP